MNKNALTSSFIAAVSVVIMMAGTSNNLRAEDIKVDPLGAKCLATSTPRCYLTIQEAINSSVNPKDTVLVERGTYIFSAATLTLKDGITLRGHETAETFLSGGGGLVPIISVTGAIGATIEHFTFINAPFGIQESGNNSTLTIRNNVFNVGRSGTAIAVSTSPTTQVINNVFYLNGIAISRDDNIFIYNNIFRSNVTAISNPTVTDQRIWNNFFDINTVPTGTLFIIGTDPGFVSAGSDFHLVASSPCITTGDKDINGLNNTGNLSYADMGTYGGQNTDTIPVKVTGVTATMPSTSSISLNWNVNKSYVITGYHVYYGTSQFASSGTYSGTGATEGASPINIPSGTAATLSNLPTTASVPDAPVLAQPTYSNQTLGLSWSAATNATGYKVFYGTTSPPTTSIDAGNVTTYTLTGLTNGQTYYIAVKAYSQLTYYMAITAHDAVSPFTPGILHESAYSTEVPQGVGNVMESVLSNVVSEYPEELTAFPGLTNTRKGCFIATAAYGSRSASEVLALRAFRDRYLLTTAAGRSFVQWYYQNGPAAATILNAHAGYKPVVRAALLPVVGMAVFMTQTPLFIKLFVLLFIISMIAVGRFYLKQYRGGSH